MMVFSAPSIWPPWWRRRGLNIVAVCYQFHSPPLCFHLYSIKSILPSALPLDRLNRSQGYYKEHNYESVLVIASQRLQLPLNKEKMSYYSCWNIDNAVYNKKEGGETIFQDLKCNNLWCNNSTLRYYITWILWCGAQLSPWDLYKRYQSGKRARWADTKTDAFHSVNCNCSSRSAVLLERPSRCCL